MMSTVKVCASGMPNISVQTQVKESTSTTVFLKYQGHPY